jgi:hypothetical protein
MTPQPLPLFPKTALPHARATLEGFGYDDVVLLHDEKHPGRWRKARVIAVLSRAHVLTLRAEAPDSIVSVQMPAFKHKLRRLAP